MRNIDVNTLLLDGKKYHLYETNMAAIARLYNGQF